jgi:MFS family permease
MASFLDRDRTVAQPGFNRWLVPPAAIAIQMCIGEIYGFSVFNVPLTRAIGITKSIPGQDWTIPHVVLSTYSLGLVVLGLSAAFLGKWVERNGPRKTMFVSAWCFCSGLVVASLGVHLHSLLVVALGYGLLGGIGLGLGYIAPVSTLVKWFPDRPGMATGMAIMGFGSGALVGAPLAVELMNHFKSATSVGVQETFLVMAAGYFVMMNFAMLIVRVPAPDWKPDGWVPQAHAQKLVTTHQVTADEAIKTPQFYLLWAVLWINVTAGIGVLAQASPMAQDIFGVTPAAAARRSTACISSSDARSTASSPSARKSTAWSSSSPVPASSSRCTGPASPPSRPTSATSSAPCRSGRSTAASSPPGRWPPSSARSSSPTSRPTSASTACPRCSRTASPSISWPASSSSACSAISSSVRWTPATMPAPDPMKKTSPLAVVLAFLVVLVPLSWGLYRSVKNSLPLFTASQPAPAPAAPGAAPMK